MATKKLSDDKILACFDRLEEKYSDIMGKLEEIHEQTTKTNGRVSTLEAWRNTSKGSLAVISAIVVPILLYLVYMHLPR